VNAEQLLADAAWLRRLAASLAGNAADADDLVQESWIAVWRRRPEADRSLRPWLAKVVRDVAGMTRRSERRRVAREQAAVDPREVVSPAAMLEQVRLHRLLADLVLALAEPFRSAIVARYVEGRSAADIARSEGIPDSTVRARLREGLARLRAALDRETGERKAWAPAVLAFARGGIKVATPTKTIAAILAALIALLLIGAGMLVVATRSQYADQDRHRDRAATASYRSGDSGIDEALATIARGALPGWLAQPGVAGRRIAGRVIALGQPVGAAVVRLTSDASAAGTAPVLERRTSADGAFDFGVQPATRLALGATSPAWLAAIVHVDARDPTLRSEQLVLELEPCVASLYGRVSDAEGTPIAHAQLLREDVAGAESNEAGAYELCVRRNSLVGAELHMIVRAPGFAAVDMAIAVGGRVHHDVVLAREARISGRVVTAAGAPVANAQVIADADEPAVAVPHSGVAHPARGAAATGEDGSFRISGLEPGKYHLSARARAGVSAQLAVTTVRDEVREVTVTLSDAAVVHARVEANRKPIGGVHVAIGSASAISQPDGELTIDAVEPGDATIAVDGFELRSPANVHLVPGDNHLAVEVGALGMIEGKVRRHGAPVANARVMIAQLGEANPRNAYSDDAGHYMLTGVAPGTYHGHADAPNAAAFSNALDVTVAAAEHRTLDIELTAGAQITGVVLDSTSTPIAGVMVRFERHDNATWWDHGRCISDTAGHFTCGGLAGGGAYTPSVYFEDNGQPPLHFAVAPAPVAVADGDAQVDGIRLVVEAQRLTIRGRVVDRNGAAVGEARVLASGGHEANFGPLPSTLSDGNGAFELRGLAAGTYTVEAITPTASASTIAEAGASDVALALGACEPVHTPPAMAARPTARVVWNDRIELVGWDLPASARIGDTLAITLYYKVLQPIDLAWKVFVHVDAPKARLNADHDPMAGRCPTTAWQPGQILIDHVMTTVKMDAYHPGTLPAGTYEVWTGFFRGIPGNWQNLPISEGIHDDQQRVRIGAISIEP